MRMIIIIINCYNILFMFYIVIILLNDSDNAQSIIYFRKKNRNLYPFQHELNMIRKITHTITYYRLISLFIKYLYTYNVNKGIVYKPIYWNLLIVTIHIYLLYCIPTMM